jgi:hypothetical protein
LPGDVDGVGGLSCELHHLAHPCVTRWLARADGLLLTQSAGPRDS